MMAILRGVNFRMGGLDRRESILSSFEAELSSSHSEQVDVAMFLYIYIKHPTLYWQQEETDIVIHKESHARI